MILSPSKFDIIKFFSFMNKSCSFITILTFLTMYISCPKFSPWHYINFQFVIILNRNLFYFYLYKFEVLFIYYLLAFLVHLTVKIRRINLISHWCIIYFWSFNIVFNFILVDIYASLDYSHLLFYHIKSSL
jgi:hypothetical protein